MRRTITAIMIAGGLALMVVSYFLLSAPLGTGAIKYSNPRVQFGPVVFIVGVMLVFVSAVVYELLPERRRR